MSRSSSYDMAMGVIDTSNSRRVSKFTPSYRNASPNGPWPWMDLDADIDEHELSPVSPFSRRPLRYQEYPQNLYPNWTPLQVARSGIEKALSGRQEGPCTIYNVDVLETGKFKRPGELYINEENPGLLWEILGNERPPDVRLRAVFIENITGPVLKMFGTKYNIEPFYWSSALNHIPAQYQEDLRPGEGDHVTIALTFLRSIINPNPTSPADADAVPISVDSNLDPHAPLSLHSTGRILMLDEMALHMVRSRTSSTMLSYHTQPSVDLSSSFTSASTAPTTPSDPYKPGHPNPSPNTSNIQPPTPATTTARVLHQLVRLAGQSVYWRKLFTRSCDPTFLLLTALWHALYSWDEALASLYAHIQDLETKAIMVTTMDVHAEGHERGRASERKMTGELHFIRGHLLFYMGLLRDFRRSVAFVRDVPNPAMDPVPASVAPPSLDSTFGPRSPKEESGEDLEKKQAEKKEREEQERERDVSRVLLVRECEALLSEIERLEMTREMLDKRVKNVMDLMFATVNIADSQHAQALSETAAKDSNAMKQIAYLTMVFLPASFVASFFGMNVRELNGSVPGITRYLEVAIPLTVVTVWIIVALQGKWHLDDIARGGRRRESVWKQLWWPLTSMTNLFKEQNELRKKTGARKGGGRGRVEGLT